ncbi:hypothetical protein J7J95_03405 [bacterium]|nr:hypothetical protein [bacterium]
MKRFFFSLSFLLGSLVFLIGGEKTFAFYRKYRGWEDFFLSQSPFGFSQTGYWWDTYVESSMPLWKESGARWVREVANWSFVQHREQDLKEGKFDWSLLDRQIDRFWKAGIAPVLVLGFNVEPQEDGSLREVVSMPDLSPVIWEPHLGKRISYWENYVFHLVARYGPNDYGLGEGYGRNKVKHWEIWSGENTPFWKDGQIKSQISPEDYFSLLRASYLIIKRVDPSAKVIFGGITDEVAAAGSLSPGKVSSFNQNYLKEIFNRCGCYFFDIFAIRPYRAMREGKLNEYTADVDAFLKKNWCEKKIWITEVGSNPVGSSFQKVAQDIQNTYHSWENGSLKAEKIFWYRLIPVDIPNHSFALTHCFEWGPEKQCGAWEKSIAFDTYKDLAWRYFWRGGRFSGIWKQRDVLPFPEEFSWETGIVDGEMRKINYGTSASILGGVGQIDSIVGEDGEITRRGRGYYLHPYWHSKGVIKGKGKLFLSSYGGDKIVLSGKLVFPAEKSGTDGVRVVIQIRDPSNPFSSPVVFEKTVYYDGRADYFYLDLTPYRGEKIKLIVSEFASPRKDFSGNSYFDLLVWTDLSLEYGQFSF